MKVKPINIESAMLLVAILVFIAALLGLSAMLLSSVREREAEIRLFRVVGAPPIFIFCFIQLEALFITISSLIFGAGILIFSLVVAQDFLISYFGLHISANIMSKNAFYFMIGIVAATVVLTVIPSLNAYRKAKTSG